MVVNIVSREEGGRTAIWPPFARAQSGIDMIAAHIAFRVKRGAIVQRVVAYTPAPVQPDAQVRVGGSEGHPVMIAAPEVIECCIYEAEIINEENSGRATYRICQHMVRE